jgi:hypothetical protein
MTAGIKANLDGSAAVQVGGTDVIALTSGGAATFVVSPTTVQAGTVSAPSITTAGDTNTGIFFPAADTIAFAGGGTEALRINSSAQIEFAAGASSTPSITFTGDTNTGIYSPAADTIAFAEGGTEALRINSSAQVEFTAGSASTPSVTFTGDTNTGIYSPGADRIGFTEGGAQVGEFDASGNFKFNSGYGSVAIAYGCRVWVSFNGTGAIAVRASGNVSTLGDNGNGDYTVNFSNSMPDTNYVVTGACFSTNTGTTRGFIANATAVAYSPATGSVRFASIAVGVGNTDYQYEYISIFR